MIINHNLRALGTVRQLKFTRQTINRTYSHMASAKRIVRASDDASNLAVSEIMRAQIRGLNRAAHNTQDGISLIQTADGYLEDTSEIVNRIRELAIQAANGVYTKEDRLQLQVEISQLVDELDRITSHAQYNAVNLFTGRFSRADDPDQHVYWGSMWFHVGANMDQRTRLYINTMNSKALGLREFKTGRLLNVSTQGGANASIGKLDVALRKVSRQRADLGASQNELEYWTKGIIQNSNNLTSSESRMRDADMAKESIDYVKNNVILESGHKMLTRIHEISREVVKKILLNR